MSAAGWAFKQICMTSITETPGQFLRWMDFMNERENVKLVKPEWKKAPGWAKYLTCDSMGVWRWWEKKPKVRDGFFIQKNWGSNLGHGSVRSCRMCICESGTHIEIKPKR